MSLSDCQSLLRLENQLCFPLYALSRALNTAYSAKLRKLDLTYTQHLILLVLWEDDGLTISEIGHRLRLDHGTLTPLIRRMEKAELVRKHRSNNDEREVRVILQGMGHSIKDKVLQVRSQISRELGMSASEASSLKADLFSMLVRLDAKQPKPDCLTRNC